MKGRTAVIYAKVKRQDSPCRSRLYDFRLVPKADVALPFAINIKKHQVIFCAGVTSKCKFIGIEYSATASFLAIIRRGGDIPLLFNA